MPAGLDAELQVPGDFAIGDILVQFPSCGYVDTESYHLGQHLICDFVDDIDTTKAHISQHVTHLPACDSSLFGELGFQWSSNRAEVPREDDKC